MGRLLQSPSLVSIHAPARGATMIIKIYFLIYMFQSTPPRGGRPECTECHALLGDVSIHAPARGATPYARRARFAAASFNPRPRAGGDIAVSKSNKPNTSFNPRPRAGGDVTPTTSVLKAMSFNPRPRAGGDSFRSVWCIFYCCFNPRPRAGGDTWNHHET